MEVGGDVLPVGRLRVRRALVTYNLIKSWKGRSCVWKLYTSTFRADPPPNTYYQSFFLVLWIPTVIFFFWILIRTKEEKHFLFDQDTISFHKLYRITIYTKIIVSIKCLDRASVWGGGSLRLYSRVLEDRDSVSWWHRVRSFSLALIGSTPSSRWS